MSNTGRVCLHVTKTAGGTLKRALRDTPDLNVEFIYNAHDKAALASQDLSGVDMVYGHAIFGVDQEIAYGDNPRYLCFLRHPLSRTISHYYHLRNDDKSIVGDRIRESTDIDDFFENHSHWEFGNFLTRIISGLGRANDLNEKDIFEKAKANLDEHFDFVGFQEFFAFSVRKLSAYLETDLVFERDINVGRYDLSTVSEKTLKRIESETTHDMALYKYAIEKFL